MECRHSSFRPRRPGGTASRERWEFQRFSYRAVRATDLAAGRGRRRRPYSSWRHSNCPIRCFSKSIAAAGRHRHCHQSGRRTSSRRWPSRRADGALYRRERAYAEKVLPAIPPIACCPRREISKSLRPPSRRWSWHCCSAQRHPSARCPRYAHRPETPPTLPLRCRTLSGYPPCIHPAGTSGRCVLHRTHCVAGWCRRHRCGVEWLPPASKG